MYIVWHNNMPETNTQIRSASFLLVKEMIFLCFFFLMRIFF